MKLAIFSTVLVALATGTSANAVRKANAEDGPMESQGERGLYYYCAGDEITAYAGENCGGYQYFHASVKDDKCYYSPSKTVTYEVHDYYGNLIAEGSDTTGSDGYVWLKYYKSQFDPYTDTIKVCVEDGYEQVYCDTIYSSTPCCTECDFSTLYVDDHDAEYGKLAHTYYPYYSSYNYGELHYSCGLSAFGVGTDGGFLTTLDSQSQMRNTKKGKVNL